MVPGILGRKIGMTQVFGEDGLRITVTVLEAGPCQVQAVKSIEKDGYNSIQVGFSDTKEKRVKKPQREYLKAKKLTAKRFVRELRCSEAPDVKVGDEVNCDIFQNGDFLDVTGISKGKGFQGGTKRHNWRGGAETHGSMSHRAPGSIGQSSFPSRVFKGLGMAGHMGSEKTTVQNLEVVDVNPENNTVTVKGAVPGANGSFLVIRYAKKKPLAPREEKSQPEEEVKEEAPKQEKKEPSEEKAKKKEEKSEEGKA